MGLRDSVAKKRIVTIISLSILLGAVLFAAITSVGDENASLFEDSIAAFLNSSDSDAEVLDLTEASLHLEAEGTGTDSGTDAVRAHDEGLSLNNSPASTSVESSASAYESLIAQIKAAPAYTTTHIVIPESIEASSETMHVSLAPGATVIVEGSLSRSGNPSVITYVNPLVSEIPQTATSATSAKSPKDFAAASSNGLVSESNQETENHRALEISGESDSALVLRNIDILNGGFSVSDASLVLESATLNNSPITVYEYGTLNMMDETILKGGFEPAVSVAKRAEFNMYGGQISDNNGPGIVAQGTVNMHDGEIIGNRASGLILSAGAMYVMDFGTISGNSASGVYMTGWNTTLILRGGNISNNSAHSGGGISVRDGAQLNMTGGTISHNTAELGGAIYVHGTHSRGTLHGGSVNNNQAERGGALFVDQSVFDFQNAEIVSNTASGNGGGVYIASSAQFAFHTGRIADNVAQNGGGIFVDQYSLNSLIVRPGASFENNLAREGIMIDNELHLAHYPRISPGRVTLNDLSNPELANGFYPHQPHAFTNYDIYAQGMRPSLRTTNLSVSNTVTGNIANLVRDYHYTLQLGHGALLSETADTQLTDSHNDAEYNSSISSAFAGMTINYLFFENSSDLLEPTAGSLTLDDQGMANFSLRSNQSIVFEDLTVDKNFRIVQFTTPDGYSTSFVDSINAAEPVHSNDTNDLQLSENRSIDFFNHIEAGPVTGLDSGFTATSAFVAAALIAAILVVVRLRKGLKQTPTKRP